MEKLKKLKKPGEAGERGEVEVVEEVDKYKGLPGAHNAHALSFPPPTMPDACPSPPLTSLAFRAALPLVLVRVWTIWFLPLALPAGLRGAYPPFSIPFSISVSISISISISVTVRALGLYVSDATFFRPCAAAVADVAAGVGIHVGYDRGGGAGCCGGV